MTIAPGNVADDLLVTTERLYEFFVPITRGHRSLLVRSSNALSAASLLSVEIALPSAIDLA